jgi:hypothetical protein
MIATRPRNVFLLSVAALALLSAPLLSYAQDAATATADDVAAAILEEDVTDLGDVIGDAMADLAEGLEEDVVVAATDADTEDLDAASVVETSSGDSEEAESAATAEESTTESKTEEPAQQQQEEQTPPPQTGPFIDLFGEVLLSLEMVDETHAQVHQHYTNEILSGKKVVGLYFSADW